MAWKAMEDGPKFGGLHTHIKILKGTKGDKLVAQNQFFFLITKIAEVEPKID